MVEAGSKLDVVVEKVVRRQRWMVCLLPVQEDLGIDV